MLTNAISSNDKSIWDRATQTLQSAVKTIPVGSDVANLARTALLGNPVEAGRALGLLDAQGGRRNTQDALEDNQSGRVEQCIVEVRYTPVAGGFANHAFITTTDRDSTDFFRGGPSGQAGGSALSGSSSGASSGSSSGQSNSSDSSNSSSPGSSRGGEGRNNGPWGPIVTEHGSYRPGTIDWTTSPTGRQVAAVVPGNCDSVNQEFAAHADDIEAATVPYNPIGSNSNATAREILERYGITGIDPVVRAPGWSTQLPQ